MITNTTDKVIQSKEEYLNPKKTAFIRQRSSQQQLQKEKSPCGLTVTTSALVGPASSQQEGHGFESV